MIRVLLAAAAVGSLLAAAQADAPLNTLTAAEKAAGWRLLFDGTTTAGWRGYRQPALPEGWRAIDGALTRLGAGGDIVTIDEFADFELAIDWKLAPGGNSGIFYRVLEGADEMWKMAPEMQLLDDPAYNGITPEQFTGANYALHAPLRAAANPPGSWNHTRVLVTGAHVEHWINDVKVVEYELWTPDWERRVQASKFKDDARYGRARTGHIGLQDHGASVAFRNIKIRVLSR
jgi:3-keto-disaccharide hydrolase